MGALEGAEAVDFGLSLRVREENPFITMLRSWVPASSVSNSGMNEGSW
ncbi:MAG TPA: hypothetical protein VM686_25585 [Polyangiaceae bacterium]|nr:hypothetical protein [Polyangiaceae bacterium]